MRTDWLPYTRTAQLSMAKTWLVALARKGTNWNIPAAAITQLGDLVDHADDALQDAGLSPRNPVDNQKVRTAFGNLTDSMRDFKRRYFFMPPLTEADWVSLELHLPDSTPTHIGPPTTIVAAEITYPHKNALTLHITPVDGHRYDERADWGFRIYWGILPQVPRTTPSTPSASTSLKPPPAP